MKFTCNLVLLTSTLLYGAAAEDSNLAPDSICTETEIERDILIQYFPTLTVPCPAIGDFVTT